MQLRGTAIVVDTVAAKRPVISGSGATRSLNETESGSLVLFDRAAGIVYTLPDTEAVGLQYEFVVSQGITTGLAQIKTNLTSSSPVIMGVIELTNVNSGTAFTYVAPETDKKVAISMNGTTTGALEGSRLILTKVSRGTWVVAGLLNGTGIVRTPFNAGT